MKKITASCLALFVGVAVVMTPRAFAEHTRVTNPNAFSIELFGKAMQYAFQFDRVINDDLSAGMGFGRVPLKTLAGVDALRSVSLVPVYANYYLSRTEGALFLTAGANLVLDAASIRDMKSGLAGVEFSSAAIHAMAGIGFESRSDSGFLFRVTTYLLASSNVVPWAGMSFGYSF